MILLKNIYLALRKILLKNLVRRETAVRIDSDKVNSILVIRLDRIGDLAVSIPAIKAIKKTFPQSRLTVLLNRATIDLAELIPEIDEAIAYQGFFPSLGKLRNKKFSLVVDFLMDYTLKTAMLSYLIGAKVTLGFDIEARGQLFNASLEPSPEPKSMNKYLLDLARFLSKLAGKEEIPDTDPVLVLTPQAQEFAREFLKEKGIKDKELIFGIAPGAKFPSQCWKEERFAQLAQSLAEKYQAKIIVIASKQEEERLSKIISLMKKQPVIAAGLPLDKLAGLISNFKIMVANNSGPLHMAAALGVATVSTMGPTVPHLWHPQGKNHIVIRRDLPCSPCNRSFCREHECMELISVEEMEKAIEVLMAKT